MPCALSTVTEQSRVACTQSAIMGARRGSGIGQDLVFHCLRELAELLGHHDARPTPSRIEINKHLAKHMHLVEGCAHESINSQGSARTNLRLQIRHIAERQPHFARSWPLTQDDNAGSEEHKTRAEEMRTSAARDHRNTEKRYRFVGIGNHVIKILELLSPAKKIKSGSGQ